MTDPSAGPDTPVIRPWREGDAEAFRRLNEAWITRLFAIEEQDRVILGDPEGHIVAQGGHILMAVVGQDTIGCCALMPHGDGVFELGKMAVDEKAQGRGIGRRLLAESLRWARAIGARRIVLETNSRLGPALHLYESAGFRRVPPAAPSPYARADVRMELTLGEGTA